MSKPNSSGEVDTDFVGVWLTYIVEERFPPPEGVDKSWLAAYLFDFLGGYQELTQATLDVSRLAEGSGKLKEYL